MKDSLARIGCLISHCGLLLATPGLAIAACGLRVSKRFAPAPDPRLRLMQDRVLNNLGVHCPVETPQETQR